MPCNALACRTCGAAVVHVDDLAHRLGRGAALTEAVDALDPLAFVRVSHIARGSRLYARRCCAAGEVLALAEPDVTARISRLVTHRPRWTARQVAPPCVTSPPPFAMFLEGWKHGDLDSQSFEGSFADAGALVAAIRARATSLPAPDSIAYVLAPGLLALSGYLAFADHLP